MREREDPRRPTKTKGRKYYKMGHFLDDYLYTVSDLGGTKAYIEVGYLMCLILI